MSYEKTLPSLLLFNIICLKILKNDEVFNAQYLSLKKWKVFVCIMLENKNIASYFL